jgi:hypothetical protein
MLVRRAWVVIVAIWLLAMAYLLAVDMSDLPIGVAFVLGVGGASALLLRGDRLVAIAVAGGVVAAVVFSVALHYFAMAIRLSIY